VRSRGAVWRSVLAESSHRRHSSVVWLSASTSTVSTSEQLLLQSTAVLLQYWVYCAVLLVQSVLYSTVSTECIVHYWMYCTALIVLYSTDCIVQYCSNVTVLSVLYNTTVLNILYSTAVLGQHCITARLMQYCSAVDTCYMFTTVKFLNMISPCVKRHSLHVLSQHFTPRYPRSFQDNIEAQTPKAYSRTT